MIAHLHMLSFGILLILTGEIFIFMQTVHVDQLTGASTVLFTFILDRGITWEVLVIFCLT